MALSGNIEGRYSGYTYRITWSAAQNVSGNYSTITCKHYLICASGYDLYISGRSNSCTVNGETKNYTSPAISTGGGSTISLGTTTHTVYHNADGTKSVSISGTFAMQATISGYYVGSISASGTVTLDRIPRAATVLAAPNFTDEDNPSITYVNGAGSVVESLQACISDTQGRTIFVPYRDVSKTGSSYTFNLTDAEREALREACKNAKSMGVRFYLKTVIAGATNYSSLQKTLTIVNAEPIVSATVMDSNSKTLDLTGDPLRFVRGYSNAAYTITATASKRATIAEYWALCGDKLKIDKSGTFEAVESAAFSFSAVDSRGYGVKVAINGTLIEYVPLTCHMKVGTPTADGKCALSISGQCFNGTFGAVTNALTVQYRHSTDGGNTWGEWVDVEAVESGSNYTANITITGLDYRAAHTFQTRAMDRLNTAETATRTVRAVPVFDWGENDFNFNVPARVNGFELLQKQMDQESGYYGLIAAHNDGASFLRTPQQGLIPYEDGGSGSLGTSGWPFNAVHATAVYSHGAELAAYKTLWSGGAYMYSGQIAELSEAISKQAHGVVLVWSAYANNTAYDYDWHYQFIPKHHVAAHGGTGVATNMATVGFGYVGSKYVYVYDGYISGHADNNKTGTSNGITYNNGYWVMRYVLGV